MGHPVSTATKAEVVNRYVPIVVIAVFLGGCAPLAGIGGSIMSTVGGGAIESYEEKKAAIALWKIEKARLLAKVIDRMETAAERLFAADKYDEGIAMLRKVIAVHDEQQPLWLIQKFIRRRGEETGG